MVFDGKKWPDGAGRDPEKVKAEKRRYYLRHKQSHLEKARAWTLANPEKRKEIVARNNAKSAERKISWHQVTKFGMAIDRSRCEICLETPSKSRDLVVHHRDGNNGKMGKPLNNNAGNLVVLCRSCHPSVHSRWGLKVVTNG